MSRSETYATLAPKLLVAGYEVLPIVPNQKRPDITGWTDINFRDPKTVDQYIRQCPSYGVGVKTGDVVVIDIDCPREDLAIEFQNRCFAVLGEAPVRIGKAPKRALYYRIDGEPLDKKATQRYSADGAFFQVEVLGQGQQCVIYGVHPDTNAPYNWVGDSLEHVPFDQLVPVTKIQIDKLLREFCDRLGQEFGKELIPEPQVLVPSSATLPTKLPNEDPLIDALGYLDPQSYEMWISVGHALKASGRKDAQELFQHWSAIRPDGSIPFNYQGAEDVLNKFQKFKPNRTSLNAIFTKASISGWTEANTLFDGIISHTSIARHLIKTLTEDAPKPVFDEGKLWTYQKPQWQPMSASEQRLLVQDLDGMRVGKKVIVANKSFIDGVINELWSMCNREGFFAAPAIGVNLTNGFVKINSDGLAELTEHDPSHAKRHTIDAIWTGSPTNSPTGTLQQLLDGCFGTSDESERIKRLLFQVIGVACASMATDLTEPKAFVFYGPTAANGKSQILDLIRYLMPAEAVTSLPPSDFAKEQFVANLIGKSANLTDELSSSKAIASDKMKQVITGDMMTCKIVYQPPFAFRPQALNIFATNTLPSFQGGVDSGVERRLAVIPFDMTIPKSDRVVGLGRKVAAEHTDLIIALAIEELGTVLSQGYFDLPTTVVEATEQWFHDADLVLMWLDNGGLERHVKEKPLACLELFTRFKDDVRDITDGAFLPGHKRFVETLRGNLKHDPEFELVRLRDGNTVRRRLLV